MAGSELARTRQETESPVLSPLGGSWEWGWTGVVVVVGWLDDGDDAGGGHLSRREGPAGHSSGKTLEGLVFGSQGIQLQPHAGVLAGQLVHLLLQLCLLSFKLFLLGDTFDAAAGGIAPVLQGPSPLLQPDNILLGQPTQVLVELPHRHGHQLIVAERRGILANLPLDLKDMNSGWRTALCLYLSSVKWLFKLTFKALLVLKWVVIPCMQTTGQNLTEDKLRNENKWINETTYYFNLFYAFTQKKILLFSIHNMYSTALATSNFTDQDCMHNWSVCKTCCNTNKLLKCLKCS